LGPVKQFVEEGSEEPLTLAVYPGTDSGFLLYEDDGKSFDYQRGEWMGIQMSWHDRNRVLELQLAPGSKMLAPLKREINVKVGESGNHVQFDGRLTQIRF
jgi:alpha-D-xyloside xylohydrolase